MIIQNIIISGLLTILASCNPFEIREIPKPSEKELISNFNNNSMEISRLKQFYNSITPQDFEVYIEYKSDTAVDLLVYYILKEEYPRKMFFEQWNFNPYDYKASSNLMDGSSFAAKTKSLEIVKARLGWNDQTFKDIKIHLDKANCISVTNGNPTNLGFKRRGLGMYFYNIFDKPLSDELKQSYNDSCQYRLYNDTLALEYRGGGFGSQCFPDR